MKDPEQLCKDFNSIKDETSMYMEKPKVNDLHSDGLNILEDNINDILETSVVVYKYAVCD